MRKYEFKLIKENLTVQTGLRLQTTMPQPH